MEKVNHPLHYISNGVEVIDVIERWGLGFELGNALKYICRAGRKEQSALEDLEKAVWYAERAEESKEMSSLYSYQPAKHAAALPAETVSEAFSLSKNLAAAVDKIKSYSRFWAVEDLMEIKNYISKEIEELKGENNHE